MKDFERIKKFIVEDMRMSHVYQPVMLAELLSSGGKTNIESIAKQLLLKDRSQVEYYENITKNMVGKVLTRNRNITERLKNDYSLIGYESLSEEEVSELLQYCESKIEDYIESRGGRIWAHRSKSAGYVSGSVRYNLLKRAKSRCELCGITADQKALEIDHIIPRNKGGSDEESNLQVLCYSCNASKRDTDDTDFRGVLESYNHREQSCTFCRISEESVLWENELAIGIADKFAVTAGHTLLLPKRHIGDYFDLYKPEKNALDALVLQTKTTLQQQDSTITGFNIGANSGASAGQTIFHAHMHLIPRRDNDIKNPRGGVRGVIPNKQNYSE